MHENLIAKDFAGDDGRLYNLQYILCLARNIAKMVYSDIYNLPVKRGF
jgi:hypothetical protein